jgi:hypothetical protein
MRSLFLHVSALNDDEYTLFTTSFADLVAPDPRHKSDDDFEKPTVPSPYARPAPGFAAATLTSPCPISTECVPLFRPYLTLFSPPRDRSCACSPQVRDTTRPLAGGQFFATLRLVLHVRDGAEFDRNLVFKQGGCSPVFFISDSFRTVIGARKCRALRQLVSPRASSPTVNPCLFCAGRTACLSRSLTGSCGVSCHQRPRPTF